MMCAAKLVSPGLYQLLLAKLMKTSLIFIINVIFWNSYTDLQWVYFWWWCRTIVSSTFGSQIVAKRG